MTALSSSGLMPIRLAASAMVLGSSCMDIPPCSAEKDFREDEPGENRDGRTDEPGHQERVVDDELADAGGARSIEVDRCDDGTVVRDEEIAVHSRKHADQERRRDAERKAERHQGARGRRLA